MALDALRGLAILAMVLAGNLPGGKDSLPAWMYHAQVPPPAMKFNPQLPGITWVDLVFPFFLFALGAAIPLALAGRLDRGASSREVVLGAFRRGGLLAFFALYQAHTSPWGLTGVYGKGAWWITLGAFALLFPVLARLPERWSPWTQRAVRIAGWAGVVALLATLRYEGGGGFSLGRNNIILVLLADAVVFGTLIWLATRGRVLVRLAVLAAGLAIHAARNGGDGSNWIVQWTELQPLRQLLGPAVLEYVTWAFHPRYLKYLFIVIPGTIAGEILLSWMRGKDASAGEEERPVPLAALAVIGVALNLVTLVGLKGRWVGATVLADGALLAAGWFLLTKGRGVGREGTTFRVLRETFAWGSFWLLLGLLFEPYQGGIRKDHATLSYYFVTTGLAHMALLALFLVGDVFRRPRPLRLLADNGQNPMIAYVAAAMVVYPVLQLTGLGDPIQNATPGPWLGLVRAVLITLTAALVVSAFTHRKIYWRT